MVQAHRLLLQLQQVLLLVLLLLLLLFGLFGLLGWLLLSFLLRWLLLLRRHHRLGYTLGSYGLLRLLLATHAEERPEVG